MSLRRVHRLNVVAPDEAGLARGRWLVEDALNTASFGDHGRLLIIRRLELADIDPRASPASVALRIEQNVRALGAQAVHAAAPGAATAPAVYFDDPLQPFELLLRQLCCDRGATDAWYWPRVVPTWSPELPRSAGVRAVLAGLLSEAGGLVAAARLFAELMDRGSPPRLCDLLDEDDAAALLAACGLHFAYDGMVGPHLCVGPEIKARIAAVRAGGSARARNRFFAALLLIAERPVRAADRRLPTLVDFALSDAMPVQAPAEARIAIERSASHESAASPASRDAPRAVAAAQRRAGNDPVVRGSSDSGRAHRTEPAEAVFSDYAGLVFLLTLLGQLRFDRWLECNGMLRDGQWPERILLAACDLVRTPREDALRRIFAVAPLPGPLPAWTPPWEDAAHLPARCRVIASSRDLRAPALGWLWRARRSLRGAGLSLRALACRRGLVRATSTHLDVVFPLSAVDLRIRKAGLDIDCGWLPWLGRVVSFHYQHERVRGG